MTLQQIPTIGPQAFSHTWTIIFQMITYSPSNNPIKTLARKLDITHSSANRLSIFVGIITLIIGFAAFVFGSEIWKAHGLISNHGRDRAASILLISALMFLAYVFSTGITALGFVIFRKFISSKHPKPTP